MKSVLISIQPGWCKLIALGQKTVEIRKTKPKLETPFKCYIYCTKGGRGYGLCKDEFGVGLLHKTNREIAPRYNLEIIDGKVIGEFLCDNIYDITPKTPSKYECGWNVYEDHSRLTFDEMRGYLGDKAGYGWHITDLVIYDKPKELREFVKYRADWGFRAGIGALTGLDCNEYITRPPQSWMYVEVADE